jgi:hypothetical protein
MSWGGVENTLDELSYLVGATITKVEILPDAMGEEKLVLSMTAGTVVQDQHRNASKRIEVEVWQDEEGNGPGFLALTRVGGKPERPKGR